MRLLRALFGWLRFPRREPMVSREAHRAVSEAHQALEEWRVRQEVERAEQVARQREGNGSVH
jgi:hypothetical protein